MSTDGRPDSTYKPEKDLFLKVYEEQLELLSPEARDFCRQRFPSHADLIPWLLRLRSTEDLNCEGLMRRDMAVFIAKIRFLLEEAGYPLVEDDTPEESRPKSLFPRLKSLWHSLTTPTAHDDGFDDFFEKVARIEISHDRTEKYCHEIDKRIEEENLRHEKWRRDMEEKDRKSQEEHRKFMEELKRRDEEFKRQEEEWERQQEERKQKLEEWKKEQEEKSLNYKEWERERKKKEKKRRLQEGREKIQEDLEKWKENKRKQAGNGPYVDKVDDSQEDEEQQYISSRWRMQDWDSINEEYLRRVYHDLICLFPYQVRRTIFNIIPTLDVLRRKTDRNTSFSHTLRHKYELDQVIEIFKFVNDEYPYQISDIGDLYEQMTGKKPHHDLTPEESETLRLLENADNEEERERLLQDLRPCRPSPTGYSYYNHHNPYLIDPHNAVFCEQRETAPPPRLDELFSPDTAYPDFIIIAVTLVQAAREVSQKLFALRRRYGNYDRFAVISTSATRIRLYASYEDLSLTNELFLIKKEDNLYVSYDGDTAEKEPLDINAGYFDSLCEKEREHRQWLDRLRTILLRLSDNRLVVFSDFYTIKIFDKYNQLSCSLYTLIRWIENHSIWDVAKNFHVNERPSDRHPWNFPGKFHY